MPNKETHSERDTVSETTVPSTSPMPSWPGTKRLSGRRPTYMRLLMVSMWSACVASVPADTHRQQSPVCVRDYSLWCCLWNMAVNSNQHPMPNQGNQPPLDLRGVFLLLFCFVYFISKIQQMFVLLFCFVCLIGTIQHTFFLLFCFVYLISKIQQMFVLLFCFACLIGIIQQMFVLLFCFACLIGRIQHFLSFVLLCMLNQQDTTDTSSFVLLFTLNQQNTTGLNQWQPELLSQHC